MASYKAYTYVDPTGSLPEVVKLVVKKNVLECVEDGKKRPCAEFPWEELQNIVGEADDSSDHMDQIKFTHVTGARKNKYEFEIEEKIDPILKKFNKAQQERAKEAAREKARGRMEQMKSNIQNKKTVEEIREELLASKRKKAGKGGGTSKTDDKYAQRKQQFEENKAQLEREKREKAEAEAARLAREIREGADKGPADEDAAAAIQSLLLRMNFQDSAKIHKDIDATIYKHQKKNREQDDANVDDDDEDAKMANQETLERMQLVRDLRAACDVQVFKGKEMAPLPKCSGAKTSIRCIAFRKDKRGLAKDETPHTELHIECVKSSGGTTEEAGPDEFAYHVVLRKRYSECQYLNASMTHQEHGLLLQHGFFFPSRWPRGRCMYIMEKWFNEVVRRATQTYGMMMRGIQPDLRKHFSVATAEEVRKFFDETLKIKKNNMWKLTMTTEIKRMISFDQFKLANATAWVAATQFKKRCKGNYSEYKLGDMAKIGEEVYWNMEPTVELRKMRNKLRHILKTQRHLGESYEGHRAIEAESRKLTIDEKRANSKEFRAKRSVLRIKYDLGDTYCRICCENFVPGDRTRLLLATPPELLDDDKMTDAYRQCGHSFHEDCIAKCNLLKAKMPACPVCKVVIDKTLLLGKSGGDEEKKMEKKRMQAVLTVKDHEIDAMLQEKKKEKEAFIRDKDFAKATAIHKEIAILQHKQGERDDKLRAAEAKKKREADEKAEADKKAEAKKNAAAAKKAKKSRGA